MNIKNFAACLLVIGAGSLSSLSATVITGTDFNNSALVGVYNGTYVNTPTGHMHLSYTDTDDDAVVGAKGPFGILSSLNMSFDYSNLVGGDGNQPYAAFGVSLNNLWNGSAQEFLIIAMSGNQINGSTGVHVYDVTSGTDYAPVVWGSTLDSILGDTFGGVAFGNMQVMRAYAYIGDWPDVGNVSVDINSITVTTVPDSASTIILSVLGLSGLMVFSRRQKRLTLAN